jgi:hypothetical protein
MTAGRSSGLSRAPVRHVPQGRCHAAPVTNRCGPRSCACVLGAAAGTSNCPQASVWFLPLQLQAAPRLPSAHTGAAGRPRASLLAPAGAHSALPRPHPRPAPYPQALLSLIAFAAAAYVQTKGFKEPHINFMVFVGVTGWLIAMFYAIVSCAEGLQRFFWGIVEVAVTGLWVLFWMAGSAAFAADQRCKIDDILDPFTSVCKTFVASEAFGWMSFLTWIPSLALAIVDWRRGEVWRLCGRQGGGVRLRRLGRPCHEQALAVQHAPAACPRCPHPALASRNCRALAATATDAAVLLRRE